MKKILETYSLPRLSQEEIEYLDRQIEKNWIEIKNLSMKKHPGPKGFTFEFHQIFKELAPILLKLSQSTEEEEILPHLLYEASIILISNQKGRYSYVSITDGDTVWEMLC